MSAYLWGLLSATLAGIFMAVQGTFNAQLGKRIGLWETNLIVHLLGFVLLLILLFLFRIGQGNWEKAGQAPWYVYLGGVLSILIIFGVAAAISRLGVIIATTSIVTGQLLTAALLDHFGLFGLERISFTWLKGVGVLLLIVGARLILQK